MLERAGENVGELIIGRLVGSVIVRVGGAEFRQHRIDRHRRFLARAGSDRLRTVARFDFLPVKAMQARVVEAVARQFPDLVEVGGIAASVERVVA